jgi:hypothetical protein
MIYLKKYKIINHLNKLQCNSKKILIKPENKLLSIKDHHHFDLYTIWKFNYLLHYIYIGYSDNYDYEIFSSQKY